MVAAPKDSFQYPKSFVKMFHYPAPLEEAGNATTASGPKPRQHEKSKRQDFDPAAFNDLLDGTDLLKGENCFRSLPHPLPSRTGRSDRMENNMSLDNILEHVQEWKTEFGINDEAVESHHRSAQDFEDRSRPVAPGSPTSHTTSCNTGSRTSMTSGSGSAAAGAGGKYDVTRSLRRKGTGPPAAAATLLSSHGGKGGASRRSSIGSAPVWCSETPIPSRETPERALSFSQLAARQRKTSFSELAAQRGVQW
jgi:hypothetical protein